MPKNTTATAKQHRGNVILWSTIIKTKCPDSLLENTAISLTIYKPQEERHTKNIYKSDGQKHSIEGAIYS